MERIDVHPNKSNPPPTVTIYKQDLVTLHRCQDETLYDVKMDIGLERVYELAEDAVSEMQT